MLGGAALHPGRERVDRTAASAGTDSYAAGWRDRNGASRPIDEGHAMRRSRITFLAASAVFVFAGCQDSPTSLTPAADRIQASTALTGAALLGQKIFEDVRLSVNNNQSCQTCHEPGQGFAAPSEGTAHQGSVVQGSVAGRFGNRKPPTAAYATITPLFSGGNNPTGGLFWDGRATGHLLGNPAADQALGPFLNPAEQALPDKACVIYFISGSDYRGLFASTYGAAALDIGWPGNTSTTCTTPAAEPGEYVSLTSAERTLVNEAYDNVGRAIAAFEATLNLYSSSFDAGQLTALAQQGQKLFTGKGKCGQCHSAKGSRPAFTDFAFHNLGVPKNPANPVWGWGTPANEFDPGLGGFTGRSQHLAKIRTPTVRNVGMGQNRTFMHNGALLSLKQVVDFYNTRDALPRCTDEAVLRDPRRWGSYGVGATPARCWPAPQHAATMDSKNMGKLGLSDADVDAIVAFMMALTDG
jgi:cytochrome c peroxidase